jgi:anti-sigma regulatory factor (Ser/Thr protein kinase)
MVEYRAKFRATPASVREARNAIVDYARLCGFDNGAIHEIALAAGEALANAVEHGSKSFGLIDVRCNFADDELIVEVSDSGGGFDHREVTAGCRDPESVRGFGISIMHAVMDRVQFEANGATVRLRKERRREPQPVAQREKA